MCQIIATIILQNLGQSSNVTFVYCLNISVCGWKRFLPPRSFPLFGIYWVLYRHALCVKRIAHSRVLQEAIRPFLPHLRNVSLLWLLESGVSIFFIKLQHTVCNFVLHVRLYVYACCTSVISRVACVGGEINRLYWPLTNFVSLTSFFLIFYTGVQDTYSYTRMCIVTFRELHVRT